MFSTLERARQDEHRLLDTLRQIRQAETDLLDVFGYRGSAQHIGGQLRDQEPGYGWLEDLNDAAQNAPLSDAEVSRLLTLCRTLSAEQVKEAALRQPDPAQLATPENFVRLVRAEQEAQTSAQERRQIRASAPYPSWPGQRHRRVPSLSARSRPWPRQRRASDDAPFRG